MTQELGGQALVRQHGASNRSIYRHRQIRFHGDTAIHGQQLCLHKEEVPSDIPRPYPAALRSSSCLLQIRTEGLRLGLNGHSGHVASTTAARCLAAVRRFSTKIRGLELERRLIENGYSPSRPVAAVNQN